MKSCEGTTCTCVVSASAAMPTTTSTPTADRLRRVGAFDAGAGRGMPYVIAWSSTPLPLATNQLSM